LVQIWDAALSLYVVLILVAGQLKTESGASLKGIGAKPAGEVVGSKGWSRAKRRRKYQGVYREGKTRWKL
jgi:hypothetical protein